MKYFSFRYSVLTCQLDQLWLTAALWALFVLLLVIFEEPGRGLALVRGYLGMIAPLTGGIGAAYAILHDPALELRFAAPIPPWRHLLERLLFVLAVEAIAVLAFVLVAVAWGIDLTRLGSPSQIFLTWLVAGLGLASLGCCLALVGRHAIVGAFAVGFVWMVELIVRKSLTVGWGPFVFYFLGVMEPEHPQLVASQIFLLVFSMGLWALSVRMLRFRENYL